ncbi:MAG: helix-turn-helix domain-containing protein [Candidatus Cyclobacteriaceae bacterium M3_2C_046]
MDQPELGLKIAELRKLKGLTQDQLAQECNINVRTLQRIETGKVTPRRYTLNLLFAQLDYEPPNEPLRKSYFFTDYLIAILSDKSGSEPTAKLATYLKYSWIAGIIYFVLGFLMAGLEMLRFQDELLIAGTAFYILLKLLTMITAVYFLGGFVLMGHQMKNQLLSIIALISLFALALFSVYDIASLFYQASEKPTMDGAEGITFGVIEILFGLGLLKLIHDFGLTSILAGIFTIVAGIFFLTLVFWFVGMIMTIPAEIFQIILLYKACSHPDVVAVNDGQTRLA